MGNSLNALYCRTQSMPCLEARMPADAGEGRIVRMSTPQGISFSEWKMRYHRDMPVEGRVENDLRIMFCLGEGVEWQSTADGKMSIHPLHACLCAGNDATESMRYTSRQGYAFLQISIAREKAENLLRGYLPEKAAEKVRQTLNGREFPINRDMRRLLDSFDGMSQTGSGLGLFRLECRAWELTALCLEQVLGADGDRGLHPDDLAAVRAVRQRIETDAVSVPGITELAKEYAVSASKLSRDFRQAYGVSIHACVIEARLEEAARLLASGTMNVGEVAERVGYVKHSQFSEAFRKRYGVLPKDY